MADEKRTEPVGKLVVPEISVSSQTTHPGKWAKNEIGLRSIPASPQFADVPFAIDGATEWKKWTWAEFFMPPLGQGRTIVDFRWSTVLTLVKTTDASGKLTKIYLSLVVDPGIVVWNPFVQGTEPHIHTNLIEPGRSFDWGTFPSGCGVTTYISRVIQLNEDIYDVTKTVGLTVDGFSFVYC